MRIAAALPQLSTRLPRVAAATALWLGIGLAAPLWAQDAPEPGAADAAAPASEAAPALSTGPRGPALLTLDQDRMFRESDWGAAALARAEQGATALQAENRRIEADLQAEEEELTAKRDSLTREAFTPLAAAFDKKVENHREEQDAKSRALSRQLDEDRKHFLELSLPLLVDLLSAHGAVAIIADEAVVLSLSAADVTTEAIGLINRKLPAEDDNATPPEAAPQEGAPTQPAKTPMMQTAPDQSGPAGAAP